MDKIKQKPNRLHDKISHLLSFECDEDWIKKVSEIYCENTDEEMTLPSLFYDDEDGFAKVTLSWKIGNIHITQDFVKDINLCYVHIADLSKGTFEEWEFEINEDFDWRDNFTKINIYLN
jgi:hypothetical protein